MADAALRDAERALLSCPSDPETYQRWVTEHLRSGGRDPRRDPRRDDRIGQPSGTWHDPSSGAPLHVIREVERVWPVVLLRPLLLSGPPSALARDRVWAEPGTLLLEVERLSVRTTRYAVAMRQGDQVVDVEVYTEPEYGDDLAPGAAPEVVEWMHVGPTTPRRRRTQRSGIEVWRRWAKGGTVLRVAR